MLLKNLFSEIKGEALLEKPADLDLEISGIAYDSRNVSKRCLFIALPGTKTDGHHYLRQAIESGACALVTEKPVDFIDLPKRVPILVVSNTRVALAQLSSRFHNFPSSRLKMIGVTGTNGKTTLTYLLEWIFKKSGFHPGVTGTVSNRFGKTVRESTMTTLESLEYQALLSEMQEAGTTHVISEVSSHAIDQSRCDATDFDGCVFTNLSRDHLEYHGDMEKYFRAKARLFWEVLPASGKKSVFAVLNSDNPVAIRMAEGIYETRVAVHTTSIQDSNADFCASQARFHRDGFFAVIEGKKVHQKVAIDVPLLGQHNLSNVLQALAVCYALHLDLNDCARALREMPQIPGRLEKVPNSRGRIVLVDYAHTPDALEKVLNGLRPLLPREGQLICLFGCGGDRDAGKRPIMGGVVERFSDRFIITSDNPRTEDPLAILGEIQQGITKEKPWLVESDREKAIGWAISQMKAADMLLIAGKGHENYQVIGREKRPFSDVAVAKKYLEAK